MFNFDMNKFKTVLFYVLAILVAIVFIIFSFYIFAFLIALVLVVWLIMFLKRKFGKTKPYTQTYTTKKKTVVIDVED